MYTWLSALVALTQQQRRTNNIQGKAKQEKGQLTTYTIHNTYICIIMHNMFCFKNKIWVKITETGQIIKLTHKQL